MSNTITRAAMIRDAKHIARQLGFLLLSFDGEFIVRPMYDNNDDRSYFTNDLDDAIETARAMAITITL